MSLTIQEILKHAPAAGATRPASHCSPQYVMVPTIPAVEALLSDGYVVVEARQDRARPDAWGREKHVRHMIRFRAPEHTGKMTRAELVAGVVRELLLLNSSDGSCPFDLKLGFYRQVCSNGMIAFVADASVVERHRFVEAQAVIDRARALSASSKPLFDRIAKWQSIRLNDTAQQRYAAEAMALRMGPERVKDFSLASMLEVRRPEDAEPTLWNVFNRVQEAGMRGYITGQRLDPVSMKLRALSTKPITAIGAEVDFNEQLWALTERWAALVK